MSPLHFFLFVLLSLPLAAYSVPTFNIDAIVDNTTGNVAYLVRIKLTIPPSKSESDIKVSSALVLDVNSNLVSLSSNCSKTATLWAFDSGDGTPIANPFDQLVGDVALTCGVGKPNILGISSKSSSFPAQVSKAGKLPLRFGYDISFGDLFIGRQNWVQFINTVPEVLSFINIPLKTDDPKSAYLVKLTGVGYKSFLIRQRDYVEMSTTQRFTTLPRKMYNFVLGQFQHEAEEKKIGGAGTGFGKLTRCYKMKKPDVKMFRNVTMVFNSNARWIVPAEKYLVAKPKSSNVFCFGFVEAVPGGRGVIGTLQQENRAIEYMLENKTLRVSLPLTGALWSP